MEEEKSIFDHLRKREIPMPDPSYFEALASQIPLKKSGKAARIIPLRRIIIWSGAAAAAIVLAFFTLMPDSGKEVNLVAELQDLSHCDVYAYVEDHLEEFDTELIVSVLPEENVESVELPAAKESIPLHTEPLPETVDFNTLEQDDILDYLESIGLETTDLDDIEI